MCGIVGIHGRQEDAWIDAMNLSQFHRGPDGAGVFRDRESELTLAMRRLAIIDVDGGVQPMSTTDGRYTIVYNGEIYNAPELRRALEACGETFASDHSDTEVLLRLMIVEGVAALHRLNGMFSFAFYDRTRGILTCARDRFGIKPFHYAQADGRLAFASELKSLLALPFLSRELDPVALHHFMSLMYVPGENSILQGVKRLPPGGVLTYWLNSGRLDISTFTGSCTAPDHSVAAREWPERLRDSFRAAVQRWSLADVPVACSLSGGLDSSAIVGALAESGARPQTFALGFTGPDEADWNELPRARLVAQHWGTEHHELVLDPDALLDDLISMVWHLDEPYGGGLPSWSVFKFMGQAVKVGMTGTGGDELFGNYGKWRHLEGGLLARRFPKPAGAGEFERQFFERYYYASETAKRDSILVAGASDGGTSELLYGHYYSAQGSVRDRIAAVDIGTQLPDEFLHMTDRFSMAHSLEARTPFLDSEFANLVMSIPSGIRTHRNDLKGLLRRTVAPLLPPSVQHMPKKGFVIPLKHWLRGSLRPLAERLLAPERLRAQGLFRPVFYEEFVLPHLDGHADHTAKVWAAVMFQLWHMIFLERSGPPDFTLTDLRA
jgi:asparagine synthase (glutamine-hydrolysing)